MVGWHLESEYEAQRTALRDWCLRLSVLLIISAVVIVVLAQYTDLDTILADYYFDTQRQVFPWDKTWFARNFMHGWVKNVLVWSGFALMGAMIIDAIRPLSMDAVRRARLRVLGLAAFCEPLVVRTLKSHSNLHCPWGIDRYGGDWPLLRLLDAIPDGWQAGRCFPAGHASAAMWLSALAVLWLPHNPRRASVVFLGGMGVGLFLGWVQQMRGQHFLSHTLATAWISSALIVGLIAVFSRQLTGAPGTAARQVALNTR